MRFYDESQLDRIKNALFEYDQNNDTKAASGVSLGYLSGQVCSDMTASLLIQIDTVYSSWPLSFSFMMHLLLRVYLTNSWPSQLLGGMCRQVRSQTLSIVWVLRPTFMVIG